MKEKHRDDSTCEWPQTPSLFAFPVRGLALSKGRDACLTSLSHLLHLLGYIVNLSHLRLLLLLKDILYFRYVNTSNLATAKSFCWPGVIYLFMMVIFITYFILRFLISACCSHCYCSEFQRQETDNLSKPQL